jgi:hypothetical protein
MAHCGQNDVAIFVPRHVKLLGQGVQLQADVAVTGDGNLSEVRATPHRLRGSRRRVRVRVGSAHQQFESHVLAELARILLVFEAQQLG